MAESTITDPEGPMLSSWSRQLSRSDRRAVVALADGDDPRVRQAAQALAHHGVVPLLVCRTPFALPPSEAEVHLVGDLARSEPGQRIVELGRERGWSDAVTLERQHDPTYLAAACVSTGVAVAAVAGATQPTADVLRAGLQVLGLANGSRLVSSSFLLLPRHGETLAFGDCAVVPEPDEEQLADIAANTADTYAGLTGRTPHVAMLSFSTHGSADHVSVRKVRSATRLVRERRPDLNVDGELQFDAAIVGSVALSKAPGSRVAGRANVLIFPNLAAGNIGYKIAQRLGGAEAFGPIIQGLAAPMNDLSRGCSTDDVVNVAVLSALQARTQALARPHSM